MRKGIPCLILLLSLSFHACAWGPTGHRVTGRIAEKYLSKKARNAIHKILEGESLAMASTWMDEVRSDSAYDYMVDWHWVTIPEGMTYEKTSKNPNGDILETIERMIAALKTGKVAATNQAEYLKILIHLTGDLHQPLHVGDRDNRGGNDVRVMWFGSQSNLHRIWDSDMIDHTRLSYTELAQSLKTPSRDQIAAWQSSSIYDWARESQSFNDQLYDAGNGRLGYEYAYVNLPVVRHRLLQAGIRLAGILNDIFG